MRSEKMQMLKPHDGKHPDVSDFGFVILFFVLKEKEAKRKKIPPWFVYFLNLGKIELLFCRRNLKCTKAY